MEGEFRESCNRSVYKKQLAKIKIDSSPTKRRSQQVTDNPFGFSPYDNGFLSGNYAFGEGVMGIEQIISELDEQSSHSSK